MIIDALRRLSNIITPNETAGFCALCYTYQNILTLTKHVALSMPKLGTRLQRSLLAYEVLHVCFDL
jgi:hypothetical protein